MGRRGSADPEKALAAVFNTNTRVPLKQHCLWILETSGVEEAAEFLVTRLEMNLIDNEGRHRDGISLLVMRSMINCLQGAMRRDIADFQKRLLDATKPTRQKLPPKGNQVIVSQAWETQKQRIIEADNQRRANNAAFRQHLEHTRRRPSAKRAEPLQERNRHLLETTA